MKKYTLLTAVLVHLSSMTCAVLIADPSTIGSHETLIRQYRKEEQ